MNIGKSNTILLSVQQYQNAYDKAIELYNLFEDSEADELLRFSGVLAEEADKLINLSGLKWEQCGNLGRHLHFLDYYLKKNDKQGCTADIRDIVFYDLPTALKNIISSATTESHFDQKLRDAVLPLIQGGHYDSAIRKAFIVLTDRLRRAFGVTDKIDGDDLVNLVFGKGGKIPVALDDSKKQCYRNLISGFYGVYRNKYAHHDIEPSLSEAKAILEMANNIIFEIEQISINSAK
ncbi:MAG: TIGR02391 family protein [Thermodesulfobacteriota bacterium]|nr:TIGR02391 family protein [Thermodesulfobacteriota bacterium]